MKKRGIDHITDIPDNEHLPDEKKLPGLFDSGDLKGFFEFFKGFPNKKDKKKKTNT